MHANNELCSSTWKRSRKNLEIFWCKTRESQVFNNQVKRRNSGKKKCHICIKLIRYLSLYKENIAKIFLKFL